MLSWRGSRTNCQPPNLLRALSLWSKTLSPQEKQTFRTLWKPSDCCHLPPWAAQRQRGAQQTTLQHPSGRTIDPGLFLYSSADSVCVSVVNRFVICKTHRTWCGRMKISKRETKRKLTLWNLFVLFLFSSVYAVVNPRHQFISSTIQTPPYLLHTWTYFYSEWTPGSLWLSFCSEKQKHEAGPCRLSARLPIEEGETVTLVFCSNKLSILKMIFYQIMIGGFVREERCFKRWRKTTKSEVCWFLSGCFCLA